MASTSVEAYPYVAQVLADADVGGGNGTWEHRQLGCLCGNVNDDCAMAFRLDECDRRGSCIGVTYCKSDTCLVLREVKLVSYASNPALVVFCGGKLGWLFAKEVMRV